MQSARDGDRVVSVRVEHEQACCASDRSPVVSAGRRAVHDARIKASGPCSGKRAHGVQRAVMLSVHRGATWVLCIRIHCRWPANWAGGSAPTARLVAKISEPGGRCNLACTCLVKSRLGDRQSSSLACGACNVAGASGQNVSVDIDQLLRVVYCRHLARHLCMPRCPRAAKPRCRCAACTLHPHRAEQQ